MSDAGSGAGDPEVQRRTDTVRPWYRRRWVGSLLVLAVVAAIVIVAVVSGDDDEPARVRVAPTDVERDSAAARDPDSEPGSAVETIRPAALPLEDGDWRLESVELREDDGGTMGGTARVTYTGDDASGGSGQLTVTAFRGDEEAAVLQGDVDGARAGEAQTVELSSTEPYEAGPYEYVFDAGG
jgi:hypothetical protein